MACSFVLVPGELLKQQLQSAVQPGTVPLAARSLLAAVSRSVRTALRSSPALCACEHRRPTRGRDAFMEVRRCPRLFPGV